MPHTYVYPRHGGMRPGTGQRIVGGFAYGLGCPPAADCVSAASQLADWHVPTEGLDPTKGWGAMLERYNVPSGGVVKVQGMGVYGTGMQINPTPWVGNTGPGAEWLATQNMNNPAYREKMAQRAEAIARRDGGGAALTDIIRTEIQAKEMKARAEDPAVARRDLLDAQSALKRARHAFDDKSRAVADLKVGHARGASVQAHLTIMQREAEREEAAALIVHAKKAQMGARERAATGVMRRLDNAITVAQERAASFSASGNTDAANAARAQAARLTKLRHRFNGTKSHVAKLLAKLGALEQSHGLAHAAAKRHHAEAQMLKHGLVPGDNGMDIANTVGPSIPAAVQGGVVAPKSPMQGMAEVVATPVMQGYAGYGQDITASEDAAQLEADAVALASQAAQVVVNGGDAHQLLTEAETTMDNASRLQQHEMQEPLVPGASPARGALLANPLVLAGLAAAAFFFLKR